MLHGIFLACNLTAAPAVKRDYEFHRFAARKQKCKRTEQQHGGYNVNDCPFHILVSFFGQGEPLPLQNFFSLTDIQHSELRIQH